LEINQQNQNRSRIGTVLAKVQADTEQDAEMRQVALKTLALAVATGAAITLLSAAPSYAGFIKDPNPGGDKLYNDVANANATSFTATVGNSSGPAINVGTTGTSQTGSGFAIIKPYGDSLLTQVVFTPLDASQFSAFNFRGPLASANFDGTVNVSVVDIADITYNFSFTGLSGPNADFASIGVIGTNGDTIKSVTIATDQGASFKTVKQIQFVDPPVTVPEPVTLSGFASGLAGAVALRRRKSSITSGATVA
jgi:hypothetical protein